MSYLSSLESQDEDVSTALQELVEKEFYIELSDGRIVDHKIIVEAVVTIVRDLSDTDGLSIGRIRQYLLLSKFSDSMPNVEDTKLCLDNAVEKGLLELSNEKYKITESARRVLAEIEEPVPEEGQSANGPETEVMVNMSDLSNLESQHQDVSTTIQKLVEEGLFIELSDGRIVDHKIIVEAIVIIVRDLDDKEGSSISRIRQYLSQSKFSDSMPDVDDIILCLDNAVEKGILLKLSNGKYKISDAARWVLEENDEAIPEVGQDANGPKAVQGTSLPKTGIATNISYLSSLEFQDEEFSTPLQELVGEGLSLKLSDESLIDHKIIIEAIVTAVRDLDKSEGSSINRIRQYLLLSKFSRRMPNVEDTKLCLESAVDKGLLLKLSNGKYKITENARRLLAKSGETDSEQDANIPLPYQGELEDFDAVKIQ